MKLFHENPIFWNSEIESDNFTVWNSEIVSFDFTEKSHNSLKSIKENSVFYIVEKYPKWLSLNGHNFVHINLIYTKMPHAYLHYASVYKVWKESMQESWLHELHTL